MNLSHNDTSFPYRRQLLIATVGFLAAVSAITPADAWLERLMAPLKVILIGAMAYSSVFLILYLFGSFLGWFAKFYALSCYYLGILGLILTPIILAVDPGDLGPSSAHFGSAAYFSHVLPKMAAGIFAAAAAYNWLTANECLTNA